MGTKRGRVHPLITENRKEGWKERRWGREAKLVRRQKVTKRKRRRPPCEHEEDVTLLMATLQFALAVSRRD